VDARTLAITVEKLGAGEILLNCIDQDSTNSGYDLELTRMVKEAVTVPVIASSGAGKVEHFSEVFEPMDAARQNVGVRQICRRHKGATLW